MDNKKIQQFFEEMKQLQNKYNVQIITASSPVQETYRESRCPSNMLPITNDFGDVVSYVPKPPDYWEEPGY
jgi:hypothetical protein